MKVLVVDEHKRIRLPDAMPGQRFSYESRENGVIVLTEPKSPVKERMFKLIRQNGRLVPDFTREEVNMEDI